MNDITQRASGLHVRRERDVSSSDLGRIYVFMGQKRCFDLVPTTSALPQRTDISSVRSKVSKGANRRHFCRSGCTKNETAVTLRRPPTDTRSRVCRKTVSLHPLPDEL